MDVIGEGEEGAKLTNFRLRGSGARGSEIEVDDLEGESLRAARFGLQEKRGDVARD